MVDVEHGLRGFIAEQRPHAVAERGGHGSGEHCLAVMKNAELEIDARERDGLEEAQDEGELGGGAPEELEPGGGVEEEVLRFHRRARIGGDVEARLHVSALAAKEGA